MAEPARQDSADPVYDQEGTAPSDPRPQLKALEGGGQTSAPKTGHLKSADSGAAEQLSGAERSAGQNSAGSYYKKSADSNRGFWRGPGSGQGWRRKKVGITAAVAAATAAISIAIFLSLLPLKIMHIVTNLQNRFYATSQNALEKQTDNLFKQYITKHVLPGYNGKCGSTIDRGCNPTNLVGNNPVTNLYKTWADARLENKLATNYGIEFVKKPSGWYLKSPSTGKDGINIGQKGEKIDDAFKKASISDVRTAIKNETRWNQVFFRYKVGRLLEEKYGIRRCVIFCSVTDPLANKVAEQKIAAKLYLTQRVLLPRNQTLGIVLTCLFNDCAADQTAPTNSATAGSDGALAGAPENPTTDTAIRDGLTKLAATYGITDAASVDALVKAYTDVSEKGFQKYVLTQLFGEAAGSSLSKAIPVAGWIDLVARLVNAANDSSKTIKKLGYISNASSAVALFSMYRTYADEMKSGNTNAQELGSLVDSLGSGDHGTKSDPQVGGTASAEQTPLYSLLMDNSSPASTASATSLLGSIFPQTALAATSSQDNSYSCSNGKPVPAGQPVCSEEILAGGNHFADVMHDFLNSPDIKPLLDIAQLWRASVGQVFDFVNGVLGSAFSLAIKPFDALCSIPFKAGYPASLGYCEAKDLANQYGPQVMTAVTQRLIPNPYSSNMSGGRTFDMMAAGADVAGNDSAHTTLGGQVLSSQQVATIVSEQQSEDLQTYKSEPLIARVFDKNSRYSPVTKLAMAAPMSWTSAGQSVGSIFTNPFNKLSHVFSTIFSPSTALAAAAQPDPFGVVQYGYPDDQIPDDPETYWDQNCSDSAAYAYRKTNDWNEDAAKPENLDPGSQMPTNKTANPCLLIMAATGSDGAVYDSDMLTPDDLASSSGATDTSGAGGATSAAILKNLAKQVLDNTNISYPLDAVSPNGSTEAVLQAVANGQPAPVTCRDGSEQGATTADLNPNILQAVLDMAQVSSIGINALTDKCHTAGSNHYQGLAVDFECEGVPFDITRNDTIAAKYGGKRNSETCSANHHWHYDFLTRP